MSSRVKAPIFTTRSHVCFCKKSRMNVGVRRERFAVEKCEPEMTLVDVVHFFLFTIGLPNLFDNTLDKTLSFGPVPWTL